MKIYIILALIHNILVAETKNKSKTKDPGILVKGWFK